MGVTTISRQQVVDLIMTLPSDRLVSVYDFALFVKTHPHPSEPRSEVNIFGETEAEIQADEELWDRQFAASREKLRALAHEAAMEYRTGRTKPLTFTPEGLVRRRYHHLVLDRQP